MIDLTLAEVAAATGGELVHADGTEVVTGAVEFDSREVGPGGLFVAFDGERVDGHDFAPAAIAAGATGVLGTRDTGTPGVLVGDSLTALARLARYVVDRLPQLTVVGLTGSSGKTTTKDLVAQLLARTGSTVAPPGSFNNELGHPWTVLQAGRDTRFLVLEMGARGIGHIKHLCDVAPPRIGVVLNVGNSHIGEFGSVEAIAQAKGELAEAVPAGDGVVVLNADDELVRAMASRTRGRVILTGEAPDAEVRAEDVTLDERGRPSYTLVTAQGRAAVTLAISGRHQVGNTLAAAAVALELGTPFAELPAALGELRIVSSRRMDVYDRPDGVTVIDDSYNANPASTSVARRALAAVGAGRRTTAVLGYMAELGDFEREGHEQVGRLAAELGVDRLIVVDDNAAPIADSARADAAWRGREIVVPDQPAAVAELARDLRPGDVVLVKASRYRTWQVADALRDLAATPAVTA
jgi:UDP-N-acetylmuramoyl-tripeptide--D-alanyl-D-alanine ligase